MKIEKVNDTYMIAEAPYESHRRGKNYCAKITGLDPKYIYTRTFLKKGGGQGSYILPAKPQAGDIFEVQAIYHTGSGSQSPSKDSGFYEMQSDGSFKPVSDEAVKERFRQQVNETFDTNLVTEANPVTEANRLIDQRIEPTWKPAFRALLKWYTDNKNNQGIKDLLNYLENYRQEEHPEATEVGNTKLIEGA